MRIHTTKLLFASVVVVVSACDPLDNFDPDDEFNAGGIDPFNFPPPYRGAGAIRQTAASGTFTEIAAHVKGRPVGYYTFPFSPSQLATTAYPNPDARAWPDGQIDPLRVSGPGTDFRTQTNNPVPVPMVYNFDPPGTANPFPPQHRCKAPSDYKHDVRLDAIPQNEQWNIFTFPPDRFTHYPIGAPAGVLPTWNYRPIVAEVPVTTQDYGCQSAKSERTLLRLAGEGKVAVPLGEPESDVRMGTLGKPTPDKFLAWAMIDPGSAVLRVGEKVDINTGGKVSGTSVQKYGWYGQFIVAYIDGGYIPVEDGPTVAGGPTKRMRVQRLYYPRSNVIRTGSTQGSPGGLGQGFDVLQGDRFGDTANLYSPVCEVWSYSLTGNTAQADLPKDEAQILAVAGSTLEPARQSQSSTAYTPNTTILPRYVFCLQAAPRATTP